MFLFYIILHSSLVQTFLTKQIAAYLSKKLNTEVTVGGVDINLFKTVNLDNVFIRDQKKDTLLFVDRLRININDINFSQHNAFITGVKLYNPVVNLYLDSLRKMNYSFILSAFKGEKDTTASAPWNIFIHSVEIENGNFTYKKYSAVPKEYGMNYNDICISKINLSIEKIKLFEDSVHFSIEDIEAVEKSGLWLKHLSAGVAIDTNGIVFEDAMINTSSSRISARKMAFKMKSVDDLDYFETKVKMDIDMNPSLIGAVDISYFASDLKGLKEKVVFSGRIKGTVSDLRTRNMKIRYRDQTYIAGNLTLTGLPEIDETFMMMEFSELSTSATDLSRIPVPPFDKHNTLNVPGEINRMGKIFYKGQLTGFINDFVAYGDMKSNVGNLITDISIKQDATSGYTNFKGHLVTEKFDLGQMLGIKETVGPLSLDAKVDGRTKENKLSAKIDGLVKDIVVKDYTYKNINIEGDVTESAFNGSFNVEDPNLKLGFLGKIDYSGKIPVFDFTADVSHARLKNLHITKNDSLADLSFLLSARLSGDDLNNISGKIELFSLKYKSVRTIADFGYTSLVSEKNTDGTSSFVLSSDALDARLEGKIRFDELMPVIDKIIRVYAPSVHLAESTGEKNILPLFDDDWNFTASVKNIDPVTEEFVPGLKIEKGTKIEAGISAKNNKIDVKIKNGNISYEGISFEKPELSVSTENQALHYAVFTNKIGLTPTINMRNVVLEGNLQNNDGMIEVSWNNPDTVVYKGNLSFNYKLNEIPGKQIPSLFVEANPSMLVFSGMDWYLNDASAFISDSLINIKQMTLNHESQYIYINGDISNKSADTLNILLNQMDLTNSNLFMKNTGLELDGTISGAARFSGLMGKATLLANVNVDSLKINKEDLGFASLKSEWDNFSDQILISGNTRRGNIKTLDFSGKYITDGTIDFNVTLDKLRLNLIEPFIKTAVCDVRGIASGDLRITGKAVDPKMEGIIKVQKASFMVSYLQCRYNFTSDITISPASIMVRNLDLYDMDGNKAVVNGSIQHENFGNMKFQLSLTTDRFLFLNTNEKDNELFYGKAYASGVVGISGTPENVDIEVNAKTDRNTKFYVPLSSGSEVTEQKFIHFVNTSKDTALLEDQQKIDLTGIQLNLNLQVTSDAEAQIIFDSKVGDVIRGKGNGNLRLVITPAGDFNMFGDYTIESGDYLFTLQNVINKRFEVEKGGTISWNGDPYMAILDITAAYKLKASLYDLMLDSAYKQRVPVECVLNMRNNLMKPDFQFAIKLSESDTKPNSVISSLSNEELNKQIISLLVLNRFVTPESFKGGAQVTETRSGNAVGMNSSELLSNQLSHWLSQISKDFDIGVNYRPGDELTHDEVELALSTQILNDRVTLNGNVGVGGNQATQSNNFVGDFEVDVKINKSGKLMVKGFNRSNTDIINDTAPYTQGLGLFYREDFDSFDELLKRYWQGLFRKKEESQNVVIK